MVKNSNDYLQLADLKVFDYNATKTNVDALFSKYRRYKNKEEIIRKRYKASLSLDNLGIYSNGKSDPVGNKIEQLEKYKKFIDTVDEVFKLNYGDLSKDEIVIYKKYLIDKLSEEKIMEYLNISSSSSLYARKRSCIIKVAMWFDLEVYK
ncbi:MAG: hypothetical protein IJI60_04155 [Bacilli bacterium]|nr:hypothetical protein [Bacilli bacterium]